MEDRFIIIPLESTFQELHSFLKTVKPIQIDYDAMLNDYLRTLRYYKTSSEAIQVFVEEMSQSFEVESGRGFHDKEREQFYHFFMLLLERMKKYDLYTAGNHDLNEINLMSWEIYDWLGDCTPVFRNKDDFTLDQNLSNGLYFYQDSVVGI